MIYELHGTIALATSSITERRFVSKDKFLQWAHKNGPFVGLDDALLDLGNAISIDDSTFGAYESALALRQADIPVTMFINMYNIIYKKDYFFHQLNSLLSKHFAIENIDDFIDQNSIRNQFKQKLLLCKTESDIEYELRELCVSKNLEFDEILSSIVSHARIISLENCRELIGEGVRLGNHFYQHINPFLLNKEEYENSVTLNAYLLKQYFDVEIKDCAIPFGKMSGLRKDLLGFAGYNWYLSDKAQHFGLLEKNVFNRISIDDDSDLLTS